MASLNVVICIFESRMQLRYNHLRRGLRFNITRWESIGVINQSVSFSPDSVKGFLHALGADGLCDELLGRNYLELVVFLTFYSIIDFISRSFICWYILPGYQTSSQSFYIYLLIPQRIFSWLLSWITSTELTSVMAAR